jgi:nitrite reductase/ring-hydroxylating ferredoxin subunit
MYSTEQKYISSPLHKLTFQYDTGNIPTLMLEF